jgi:hypothetical protein
LFPTKNFPSSSDFETLGNGFPCFCFSSDSWHGTGKLGISAPLTSQNCIILRISYATAPPTAHATPIVLGLVDLADAHLDRRIAVTLAEDVRITRGRPAHLLSAETPDFGDDGSGGNDFVFDGIAAVCKVLLAL